MTGSTGQSLNVEKTSSSRSVLDPIERSSGIVFGLIMALMFTCAVSEGCSLRNDVMADLRW